MTLKRQDNNNTNSNKKKIYPIFLNCGELTLDIYWEKIFEDCSKGKFPKGCSINSNGTTLYIKNKSGALITYNLHDNIEKVFLDVKEIFQSELNIKSNRDKLELEENFEDIRKELQEVYTGSWQRIKRKKIKDPIIRKYILDLKVKYDLTVKETNEVSQIIKLGFLFNWIDNNDVVYEDQEIKDITILHFDEEERLFSLDEPNIILKREYKPKINKISLIWDKQMVKPKNRYII